MYTLLSSSYMNEGIHLDLDTWIFFLYITIIIIASTVLLLHTSLYLSNMSTTKSTALLFIMID